MNRSATDRLGGLRVFVAEDHFLVSRFLRDVLLSLGCTAIGPASHLEEALRLIRAHEIDGALLDVNLGAQSIYPVASELARRSVPFIVMTGHTSLAGFPALLGSAPHLVKPFTMQQLEDMMGSTFRPQRPEQPDRG